MIKSVLYIVLALMLLLSYGCDTESDPCGYTGQLELGGTIDPDEPDAMLSSGKNADKDCNAFLNLAFWWEDVEMAREEDRPPVDWTFRTEGFMFSPDEQMTLATDPVSGEDIWYWTATIERNAAQLTDNPVEYIIEVRYDTTQVTATPGGVNFEMDIFYTQF